LERDLALEAAGRFFFGEAFSDVVGIEERLHRIGPVVAVASRFVDDPESS
jgi:hypothetical protein